MVDDDDSFAIDANGKRALIGLTAEESREFMRIDGFTGGGPPAGFSRENWNGPDDRRRLEIYEKHGAARRPFLHAGKTMH